MWWWWWWWWWGGWVGGGGGGGVSNEQCLITCLWGIVTKQQNNPNLCYHGRRGPIFFVTKYHEDFMFGESDEHLVLINFRPVSVRDHQNEGWSAKFRQTWREIHLSWLWYCNQLGVLMIHSLTHWGLATPYGDKNISQHWSRLWPVARRHQAITWSIADLTTLASFLDQFYGYSTKYTCLNLHLEIILFKNFLQLPGGNKLSQNYYRHTNHQDVFSKLTVHHFAHE